MVEECIYTSKVENRSVVISLQQAVNIIIAGDKSLIGKEEQVKENLNNKEYVYENEYIKIRKF